ncbi:hypothetical protein EG68_00562 [Paragonimus skrjabini miyazakii]|uniref:Uncharacterized protein n=1 Tax=Paragonimus skrjabini miyazakii TaxID=59628 RepID=A0A8S9Z8U7_9TREM|nr:hypothetical protein EG68_00562 [Paragonimus skrjabini miyazakii]
MLKIILVVHILNQFGRINTAPPTDWDVRAKLKPQETDVHNKPENAVASSGQSHQEMMHAAKDCLESMRKCEQHEGICKVDIVIFKRFCGDWLKERSLLGCQKHFVDECRSALKTVNYGRPNLKHCTCDGQSSRSIEDLSKCNLLRRNLISHPCMQDPPILYRDIPKADQTAANSADIYALLPPGLMDTVDLNSRPLIKNGTTNVQNATNHSVTGKKLGMSKPEEMEGEKNSGVMIVDESSRVRFTLSNQTATNVRQMEKENNIFPEIRLSNCLLELEQCTNHAPCARSLNRLRALCTPRSCEKLRYQCLLAHRDYQKYGLHDNCTCDTEADFVRRQRCLDYQLSILDNKCVESGIAESELTKSQLEYQFLEPPSITHHRLPSDREKATSHMAVTMKMSQLHSINRDVTNVTNCFDFFIQCIRDAACLWYYLRLANFCPWSLSGNSCQPVASCRELLRAFYTQSATNSRQALVCFCDTNDYDCEVQRAIFQPRCTSRTLQPIQPKCSTIWSTCQSSVECSESLKLVLFGCAQSGTLCRTNSHVCIQAYLQIWISHFHSTCQCAEGEILRLASLENVDSVTCETFRFVLGQTPCDNATQRLNHRIKQPFENPHSRTCFLTERLNLSHSETVRIDVNKSVMNDEAVMPCTRLCSCLEGCRHQICPVVYRSPLTDLIHENKSRTTHQKHGTPSPSTYSTCLYMPMADSSCSCQTDGIVWCDVSKKNQHLNILDYQLILSYDQSEFGTILRLLNENVLNREHYFFIRLIDIAHLLESLILAITGSDNCHLLLNRHHSLPPLPSNDRRVKPVENTSHNNADDVYGQLIYVIAMKSKWRENYSTQNPHGSQKDLHATCIQSVRLLGLMINHRFPHIKYHPLLSALKTAALANQQPSHKSTTVVDNNLPRKITKVNNSLNTNHQAAWRQPRTSQTNTGVADLHISSGTSDSVRQTSIYFRPALYCMSILTILIR